MNERITHNIPILEIRPELADKPDARIGNPTHVQLQVYYTTGGQNYFSGGTIRRGYYLSATPTEMRERGNGVTVVGCVLGTGVKTLLLEVNRYTDKQMGIACTLGASMAPELIMWCRREYGIVCEETAEYFPDAVKLPVPKIMPKKKERPAPAKQESKPIRSMKLLTADVIRKLEKHPFGSQEGKLDEAQVLVKFFGGGAYTFLVTEGEKQEDGDWLFFGKATFGDEWEWGYTTLSQLEAMKFPPFGLGVERDLYLASGTTVGQAAA